MTISWSLISGINVGIEFPPPEMIEGDDKVICIDLFILRIVISY